jgi:hypothetical protein
MYRILPGTDQNGTELLCTEQNCFMHWAKRLYLELRLLRVKPMVEMMNSKHIGADMNFAWPTAEIAVMG